MTAVDTHETEHKHPSDLVYVKVAVFLAVMTAIEVALSYTEDSVGAHLTVAFLLVLALIKFVTVVAYFMHLKFDHRYFRMLFVTGFILAILVYMAYLSTLHFFDASRIHA